MTVLRVTEVHNINRESQGVLPIEFVLVPIVKSCLPCEFHFVHQRVIPIGDSCVSIGKTHVVGEFDISMGDSLVFAFGYIKE